MMRRVVLASLLGVGACGLSERPFVERRQWPLIVRRPTVRPPRAHGRVLLVQSVRANAELTGRGLITLQTDGSMRTSFYEEWAVPPAQAIEDDLRQWLAGSGLYAAVLAPGSRLSADIVLDATLLAFWANLKTNRARVSLGLVLLDQRRGAVRILLQKTVTAEANLASADPPAIVAALRAALVEVLQMTEQALAPSAR